MENQISDSKGLIRPLLIAPFDPEAPYGQHSRPFNFYKYGKKQGHSLGLLSFRSLGRDAKNLIMGLRKIANRRTIIISGLNPFWVLFFILLVKTLNFFGRPKRKAIIDLHGSVFHENINYGWKIRAYFYFFSEFISLQLADLVIFASRKLKKFSTEAFRLSGKRGRVVENGTNRPKVESEKMAENALQESIDRKETKIIIMVAPRNSHSNVLAVLRAQEVMELLKDESELVLIILGGGETLGSVPENTKYLGHVPNPVYHALHDLADLAIAPYPPEAVCGGARNKILDYWIHGILLVSTREGTRGIEEAKPGSNFLLSDSDPESFAQSILEALEMGETEKDKIRRAAQDLARRKYLWKEKSKNFFQLIENETCY